MILDPQPQAEPTKRLLNNKHINELQRRAKGIREGYLHVKIHEGKVVAIADTRIHNLDTLDSML
jgi:hypothetical protein